MMARLSLFDAHCHLQDSRILNCTPQLMQKASEAGVRWFAVNGTSEDDWGLVKKMGEDHTSAIPNFGLHPWWVLKRSGRWLSTLKEMLETVPTAAVGEVGLDLGKRGSEIDEELQLDVLRQQLELGRELQRPISVHCVRAVGSLQRLLSKMGTFPAGLIMHSFTGPAESVPGLLKCGAYFSFSGFLTVTKASKAKQVLQQVPFDRMLLETDAPDALPKLDLPSLICVPSALDKNDGDEPQSHRSSGDQGTAAESLQQVAKGSLNHPANIRANLSYIASLMGISEEDLAAQTFENTKRVFSFPGSKLMS